MYPPFIYFKVSLSKSRKEYVVKTLLFHRGCIYFFRMLVKNNYIFYKTGKNYIFKLSAKFVLTNKQ